MISLIDQLNSLPSIKKKNTNTTRMANLAQSERSRISRNNLFQMAMSGKGEMSVEQISQEVKKDRTNINSVLREYLIPEGKVKFVREERIPHHTRGKRWYIWIGGNSEE